MSLEAIDYYACNTRFSYYEVPAGQGEPLHTHAVDHALFIVRGVVTLFTNAGSVDVTGPAEPLSIPAGESHGFTAKSDALLLSIFAGNPPMVTPVSLDAAIGGAQVASLPALAQLMLVPSQVQAAIQPTS